MLLCLGDLLEANASCSLEENGELHLYFQDESDILYGEDNKVVVSAGERSFRERRREVVAKTLILRVHKKETAKREMPGKTHVREEVVV